MKKCATVILSLLWVLHCSAQGYEVLQVKKGYRIGGKKVRTGEVLQDYDSIQINENGELELDIGSRVTLKLASGKYSVLEEVERLKKWYATHLELTNELKKKGLLSCRFRYKTIAVPGSDRHFEMDRIEVDQPSILRVHSDTTDVHVKWHNPDSRYKEGYLLVIRDFFNNGFVDIIEVDANELTFYPGSYGHRFLYYNVIAKDCRASLRFKIEATNERANRHKTNFIGPGQ